MIKTFLSLFVFAVILLFSHDSEAKLLRIIHTNDLHSHMEHAHSESEGGYAAVSGKIQELRNQYAKDGVESVAIDGGDFFEGGLMYLADRGRDSLRVMNAMGYDAVALGNHDWMMGAAELDKIVGEVPPKFAFLAANFLSLPSRTNLKRDLKPYTIIERGGLRIGIIGFATNEVTYRWPGDKITSPILAARKYLPELRKKTDVIIGVGHFGILKGAALVMTTKGIDVMVLAHTHKLWETPKVKKDLRGHKVPLVQAGAHGRYIGDMLVDVNPGQEAKVVDYKIHYVGADSPKNPEVAALVKDARAHLNGEYGASWLNEIVGYSEVEAGLTSGPKNPWNRFVAEAIEEAADADAGFHSPAFTYPNETLGPITRESLMKYFPRQYDINNRKGWTIWTAYIQGGLLGALIACGALDCPHISFHPRDGQSFDVKKFYKIAIPEAVALSAPETNLLRGLILISKENTMVPVWEALENKLRKIRVIR